MSQDEARATWRSARLRREHRYRRRGEEPNTSDNFLTLVFGKTVDDANNIADAYRRFAANNVGINDVLNQNQNAVMLWHTHSSQPDLDLVTGCLK